MDYFLVSQPDSEWWPLSLKHFSMLQGVCGEHNNLQANPREFSTALDLKEVDKRLLRKYPFFSWTFSLNFPFFHKCSLCPWSDFHIWKTLQFDCHHAARSPWNDLCAYWIHIRSWHVRDGECQGRQSLWCGNFCWGRYKATIRARATASFPPGEVLCRRR